MAETRRPRGLPVLSSVMLVVAAATLLTSCGGSKTGTPTLSSVDTLRAGIDAAQHMSTFRRQMKGLVDGETLISDAQFVVGKGAVISRQQLSGARLHGLVIGDTAYLTGNASWFAIEFGAAAKQVQKVVGNKLIVMAVADSPVKTLAATDAFFPELARLSATSPGELAKISTGRVVDGVPTTAFESTSSESDSVRVHIANNATHLPMVVESTDGSFEMVFSQWGDSVTLDVPAPSQTITLEQIASALGRS